MTLEKRTRVEIFLPLRPDSVVHRTLTDWLAEELAFARGGATLTTPFTGLYISATHGNILRDSVQVLFCDFDLDPDDPANRPEVVAYLRTSLDVDGGLRAGRSVDCLSSGNSDCLKGITDEINFSALGLRLRSQ